MKILNLTQHKATPEQLAGGVVEPEQKDVAAIRHLLTFNDLPTRKEIQARAYAIAKYAQGYGAAMIGGAPWLMPDLVDYLNELGVAPCYSFSKRVVRETVKEDGSVEKVSTFVHEGFIS